MNIKVFELILISIILLSEKIGKISSCGTIASGCPGKCDEGYYCGPFWAGQFFPKCSPNRNVFLE
jgi:hypothetical protein